jgi:hypothetical protein
VRGKDERLESVKMSATVPETVTLSRDLVPDHYLDLAQPNGKRGLVSRPMTSKELEKAVTERSRTKPPPPPPPTLRSKLEDQGLLKLIVCASIFFYMGFIFTYNP